MNHPASVLMRFDAIKNTVYTVYLCLQKHNGKRSLFLHFPPQVVRTVVVVLHRQWLKTKGRGSQTVGNRSWTSPGLQVLREAVMLLHWLLLKDLSFSEHCLDVLHMYDQVIPAIRDTFRLVPDLSESEGGFRVSTIDYSN